MNAQSTLDTLRTWAQTAAGDIKLPLKNVEAETSNRDEYRELLERMRDAQSWLRKKEKIATLKGREWEASLSYMGYKFVVRYKAPKHIQQAATSIQTHRETREMQATQEQAVAIYLLECTRIGLAKCTHDVVTWFRACPGHGGPTEKNSGSRAMNTLHREGAVIDGQHYRTSRAFTARHPETGRPADYYFLLPAAQAEAGQQRLF